MKYEDIELYALIGLFIFTVWFIVNTIKYYYGEKRKIRHLHRFAKEGERDAQYRLAKRYQKGDMVKKPKATFRLFLRGTVAGETKINVNSV